MMEELECLQKHIVKMLEKCVIGQSMLYILNL
jgi:hypothetical protein